MDEEEKLLTIDAYADYMSMYVNPKAVLDTLNRQSGQRGTEGVRTENTEYKKSVADAKKGGPVKRKDRPDIADRVKRWRDRKIEVVSSRTEKVEVTGDIDSIEQGPKNLVIAERFERTKAKRMDRLLVIINNDSSILGWL